MTSTKVSRNVGTITADSVSSANSVITSGTRTFSPARTTSKCFVIAPLNNTINTTTLTITGWKYNIDSNIDFGVVGVTAGALFYQRIPDVINGAVLNSIDLFYRVNGTTRTPTRLSMAVRRQDIGGFTSATLMANTQVTLYATTGFGSVVSTNFPMTGNNTIDTSLYMYMIIVTEESGSGNTPGNNIYSFRCNYTVTTLPNG